MTDMMSLEDARAIVLSKVPLQQIETVPLLEAVGRVAAEDICSDVDVAPFAHAAMDGYAVHEKDLAKANPDHPVALEVIGEVPAGAVFDDSIGTGQCVRIMTGARVPDSVDAVIKYEIVEVVEGDGHCGSRVSFSAPARKRENIREAGEEARKGQVVISAGDVVSGAGVGFLAGCGVMDVPTYRRPTVAIIATGSELVDPHEVPKSGKIRNSNSYALAACVQELGCTPTILPAVADIEESIADEVASACESYNLVVTTGGACNGDYDFIKEVTRSLGDLYLSTVNMRPGKAQTFGLIKGVPVFGLPGNPAAAYVGFQMIVRPALRKMQGYVHLDCPMVYAALTKDIHKHDPRRTFMRSTMVKTKNGYEVTPARNQSSGLFGVIQKSNCMAIISEGTKGCVKGDKVPCLLLDVSEEVAL
ncbi:MAG: molybdopterin molybdotransferase MoeA [Eggerthellaceae bacterium]|jgi:molybdopterin molybdotransferase|nr:molybdopterin molybdotransferase MoeA [Eggerthellaceae bacterium]MCH4221450.1 molybdopterin molybdotransferase MoeA [Eggerthellaceae bacterium]